jgi:hypothetical protein
VDPSYAFFFQRRWQKRLFWQLVVVHVASGCILIMQVDQQKRQRFRFFLCVPALERFVS